MEMICTPQPTPRCALIAKTLKKSRTPCSNTFGPFPDESLTAALDRLLFLLGGRKCQKYFNMTTRSQESIESECEFTVRSIESFPKQCKCPRSPSFTKEDRGQCGSCPRSPSFTKAGDCGQCGSCSRSPSLAKATDRSPCPFNKHYANSKIRMPQTPALIACAKSAKVGCSNQTSATEEHGCKEYPRQGLNVNFLKRSFSMCSLICRKMKKKLFCSSTASTPRWLWTKVQNQNNGCQVYEVFKNSTVCSHPTQFDTCRAARIIFIILPSGVIMPFETLPSH